MNDPFAAFDTIGKPKMAATTGSYATIPTPMPLAAPAAGPYNQFGTNLPPGAPFGQPNMSNNPFGMGPPLQTMSNQPQPKLYPNASSFMTQPSTMPSFGGLAPQQQQPLMTNNNNNPFGGAPPNQPFGSAAQPIMYDSIKNLLQPKPVDPFSTSAGTMMNTATAPKPPAPLVQQSSTIIDFDPFSPRDNTPRSPFDQPPQSSDRTGSGGSSALADRQNKRQTQDAARNQLSFDTSAFQNASNSTKQISLKSLAIQDPPKPAPAPAPTASSAPVARPSVSSSTPFDDSPFFMDNSDAFAGQTVSNLDDDFSPSAANMRASQWGANDGDSDEGAMGECGPDEYDVTFETGRKLGVLMERVDVWGKREDRRQEVAVVKLVVENGAADRVGVSVGSSIVAINNRKVDKDSYTTILELIKSAPRPMTVRFKRGTINKDTTQGNVLTRISNGTFSVGNFTSGNAQWTQKYFAYGGAKMDVLQLFVSRAAYHECVISLYEKRAVHTQIQSFRLCRDHKISPIKSKIYKGYGNLHYFSLTVPSLRFVAAKFASEDYETIKNLWSHAYEAIERKKRMGY